ncbi:type IV pilus assembly protein PilM [Malonomonas rubra DSM 5091]|uniref:Type IV pilus assembly protein PilM n=1 Tax=Malonomonas rubra DSM 5091 TaxID=1122189 RepID=A0A1M6D7D9_MALRU|nr:type IV pilus assembly protein PilM [Malonomonas rubra]SHI69103.1 type IV pilus assembly protein PilM [Malonomonas rubra DSM 5091]
MFASKKDIVGIDVGSSSVKLVRLRESRGNFHLVNIGVMPLAPETIVDNTIMDSTSIVEAIQNLMVGMKVKAKRVATSVSGHSVIIRKIMLPIMTEEELEASIQWEAEQYIPFDISEVNIDFQILGPDSKDPSQMNVMLVAAKKDFVDDFVSVFSEAGLEPVVMDIDCFAVENMFDYNYGFVEDEVVALIDLGASATSVNVLKGDVSVFTRDIQAGGNLLSEELQKRLGLSSEEAEQAKLGTSEVADVDADSVEEVLADAVENLVQEVQRSLDFFTATSSEDRVSKVYLTGGASSSEQIRKTLEERLAITVERADPFRNLTVNDKEFDKEYLDAIGPMFSVATGLAMRKVGDK